ncbi:PREDICTED: nucleoside diphosphate kinase-like [Nicrophorus vespilloides]|uniref:nucleoside-diphosphate kinase n=1 Tax=Nicrophorus vespilloides TaxID=110193 RepID=A0ABM1N7G4_NICVS|nr:PREDICTED: nucleoside diphosphate kinase-like [Nicrophorus vespilloides]
MICTLLSLFSLFLRKICDHEERTFLLIKPDAVQRGLVGQIIKKFEQKGFKLIGMKFMLASKELVKNHYSYLSNEPFFPGLLKYMSSGPVVPMVWEGPNVVKNARIIIGITNPEDCIPGTIRGDFSIQTGPNLIHGADGVEEANKEMYLWFTQKELISWKPAITTWVYEGCILKV